MFATVRQALTRPRHLSRSGGKVLVWRQINEHQIQESYETLEQVTQYPTECRKYRKGKLWYVGVHDPTTGGLLPLQQPVDEKEGSLAVTAGQLAGLFRVRPLKQLFAPVGSGWQRIQATIFVICVVALAGLTFLTVVIMLKPSQATQDTTQSYTEIRR